MHWEVRSEEEVRGSSRTSLCTSGGLLVILWVEILNGGYREVGERACAY